jgi:hypothetical protein
MTDRAKFEQMLDYLINENKAKAEELFHELVVSKSREIYENLLDDDIQVDEEAVDEDEDIDEAFGFEQDPGVAEVSDEQSDDAMADLEAPEAGEMGMGDEGSTEPATKGDVEEIKDAFMDEFASLKADFEAMLGGTEPAEMDDEEGPEEDGEEGPEEGGEEDEGNPFAAKEEGYVREYVEKVAPAKMGDNGANTRQIMAKPNHMGGGTSANIAKGGTSTTGGTQGGLLKPTTTDIKSGNVNVPGGKAGKTGFKTTQPGHGAEKKATGDNGDKSAGSMLNGAPNRAK